MKLTKETIAEAETAMRTFLTLMGCDMEDPNILDTPRRYTKMFSTELMGGSEDNINLAIFPNYNSGEQFVVVTELPVISTCSHHLMPIRGVAHVAALFLPDSKNTTLVPGLSKYARAVEAFSNRLQLQERLTSQIATYILQNFGADFVGVFITAEHMCMAHRGVKVANSTTVTEKILTSEKFGQESTRRGITSLAMQEYYEKKFYRNIENSGSKT